MNKTLLTSCIVALVLGSPAVAAEPKASFESMATEHCQKTLAIPACTQVKPPGPFIKRCVEDAVLTGSYEFVEAAKKDYLRACQKMKDSKGTSAPKPTSPKS
ncbi:hypothetical protein [Myxococcus stipitatus]|uniref:hypothetical protein n=1 Tax=Myxococcus stipitatus TaxID=83455 RepID=UPI0030CC3E1F